MPLNVRSIAVSAAVVAFFAVAIAGSISALAPFTCCKRALIGAVLAYIAATLAVRAINAILISAMITKQIDRERQSNSGGTG
ncbi:MAG: hypothetical protein JSW23_05880 [Planctomycetota bacterium]|nr:MAG: hypothetical protein JSW23_05880 [Planctomycetota bacterium]